MFVASSVLPSDSRIWIYQSNRPFSSAEMSAIEDRAKEFLRTWTAHDNALRASFEIRYGLFLIVMIDKNYEQASGCSIDKLFHFVQSVEKDFRLTLLDRMQFAYKTNGDVKAVSKKEFENLLAQGTLNDDTIVFNNLVETKGALTENWEVPLKKSWHRSVISH